VVICLELGADLHMAQLMPLPPTVSCFSKIQIGFTFLVPAHLGSPGKRAIKRMCVCVCVLTVNCEFCCYVWQRQAIPLNRHQSSCIAAGMHVCKMRDFCSNSSSIITELIVFHNQESSSLLSGDRPSSAYATLTQTALAHCDDNRNCATFDFDGNRGKCIPINKEMFYLLS